jgi:S-adenosylmethionine:tRNA ribosyltransferase-isomerase
VSALPALAPGLVEASEPPEARGLGRDEVRLLVTAAAESPRHRRFADLPDLLAPGDLLVVNTSMTIPAALTARRDDGREVAVHLSTPVPRVGAPLPDGGERRWVLELRRGAGRVRDARAGERLELPGGAAAELLAPYMGSRLWVAALALGEPLLDYLFRHGRPIRYGHLQGDWPLEAHQTVYAKEPGSAEMPSAGRPFTPRLITELVARGIDLAPVVLHAGVSSLETGEPPYPEPYRVPRFTAERVNLTRRLGGRVIAVGTTATRALESAAGDAGGVAAAECWTGLVLGPDRRPRVVDGILTGFHDRDSSHLSLLGAIAGRSFVERSYAAAAARGYAKHEFGDSHLILRPTARPGVPGTPRGRSPDGRRRRAQPGRDGRAGA